MERAKQKEADRQRELEEREIQRRKWEEQNLLDVAETPSTSHSKSKFVRQILCLYLFMLSKNKNKTNLNEAISNTNCNSNSIIAACSAIQIDIVWNAKIGDKIELFTNWFSHQCFPIY